MINIAIVGYGYWGPNLVRNFNSSSLTKVLYVVDKSADQLKKVQRLYPTIKTTTDLAEVLADSSVNAVVIATPVSTHFEIALKVLQAGKHVLLEKPMTDSSASSQILIEEATKRGLTLMVDHTFPYTGAVRKIKELIEKGELGEILYFDSTRVNLGLFQHDVSVIWDLAVHDLSIMEFILSDHPTAVSATGIAHIKGEPENIAYLTLYFASNLIAHINVNWLAPVKLRQTLIGGSRKMIVYDDCEPTEKIKVYDKGITVSNDAEGIYQMKVGYRTGDIWSPQLDSSEALKNLVEHFARCIENGEKPITSAESGLRVVRIMEAATLSMSRGGEKIVL